MDYLIVFGTFIYLLSSISYMAYLFAQKRYLFRIGYYLLVSGFIFHTAAIAVAFFVSGGMPTYDLSGTMLVAGWALAAVFLFLQFSYGLKILGIYAAPLLFFIGMVAYHVPAGPVENPGIFKSVWLVFHVVTVFLGEAAFALACGAGILYLIQENEIKKKSRGFFFKRLPSLELIDNVGYGCIVMGFTMMTVGLIIGFVYAKSVWGRFWGWDPKEVWSAIAWALYAVLLHGRFAFGWRGRRAAVMSIAGFLLLVFSFLGVNFILKGHHGDFTKIG